MAASATFKFPLIRYAVLLHCYGKASAAVEYNQHTQAHCPQISPAIL